MAKRASANPGRPGRAEAAKFPRGRLYLAIFAILVIVVGSALGYFLPYFRLNREWQKARAALASDDFASARTSLLYCREGWPQRPEVCLELARLERRAGDFRKARDWLLEAKRADLRPSEFDFEYLLLQAQSGAVKTLESHLKAYRQSDAPSAALAYEATVRGWIEVHGINEAHIACDAWISAFPDDWRAHYWLGWILESKNLSALAVEQYRLAVARCPDNFDARFRLEESLSSVSDFPAALPLIEECLRVRPADAAVRLALGRCLHGLGKNQEAEPVLLELVRENPANVPALLLMARLRLAGENPAEAAEFARRAARLEPTNPVAAGTLAEALRTLQSEEAAAWEEKARALTEQRDRLTTLTRDALYHERDVEVRYQLGELLLSLGRKDEAAAWFQRGLAIDPEHGPTLKALAALRTTGPAMPPSASSMRGSGISGKTPPR